MIPKFLLVLFSLVLSGSAAVHAASGTEAPSAGYSNLSELTSPSELTNPTTTTEPTAQKPWIDETDQALHRLLFIVAVVSTIPVSMIVIMIRSVAPQTTNGVVTTAKSGAQSSAEDDPLEVPGNSRYLQIVRLNNRANASLRKATMVAATPLASLNEQEKSTLLAQLNQLAAISREAATESEQLGARRRDTHALLRRTVRAACLTENIATTANLKMKS